MLLNNSMVSAQRFYTSVIGCLSFFGKETAWHALIMVTVMRHTFTTFAMSWAVISTRTWSSILTVIHFI